MRHHRRTCNGEDRSATRGPMTASRVALKPYGRRQARLNRPRRLQVEIEPERCNVGC